MSFFDKFKETAEKAVSVAAVAGRVAAETAVKQTKTAAAVGKLKLSIASEEDKLKKCYTELGRIFFRDYEEAAEAVMEEYQPWCDKAAEAKKEIAQLREQLAALKNSQSEETDVAADIDVCIPDDEEDTSIYADFVAAQPAEVALAYENTEEEPVQSSEQPSTQEPGVVGTFYLDVTGQDE